MMNPEASLFSAIPDQDSTPFDPNHNFAIGALLGFPSIDQTEAEGIYYPDPTLSALNQHDFQEQYQFQVDLFASPGIASSPSLPSSPFSSGDDLSDLGAVDASASYNPDFSPTGFSTIIPLVHLDDVRPAKPDLDGFEYNSITRKWVCTKCEDDFVSTHEARRHAKTAAKCTGKKVMCLRCGDHIHAGDYSRKRHFASKKCQKKGRKRGTPTYTVSNAYVAS